MEAREFASAAFVNADELVKYDWYSLFHRPATLF